MPGQAKQIALPKSGRQGKLSFALTPLADAMFQLLIFFMLSSSLAPYSLITLAPGQTETPPSLPDPVTTQAPQTAPVIWNLGRGQIRSGREIVDLDRLGAHVADMTDRQNASIVLFTERSARVQDIATALNVLTLNRIGSVQLVSAAR